MKRRETATERDERIVAESVWEVDMGVVVALQDDDDPMENLRACEAAARILNRIVRARGKHDRKG